MLQEDAHLSALDFDNNSSLFGVFDGHGGSEVAKYAALYLVRNPPLLVLFPSQDVSCLGTTNAGTDQQNHIMLH